MYGDRGGVVSSLESSHYALLFDHVFDLAKRVRSAQLALGALMGALRRSDACVLCVLWKAFS